MKYAAVELNSPQVLEDIYESVNLLEGIRPVIDDGRDGHSVILEALKHQDPMYYKRLTDNTDPGKHIDVLSRTVRFTYDMAKVYPVDRIGIFGVATLVDYSIAAFRVYLSDTLESLYAPSNCMAEYDKIRDGTSMDFDTRRGYDFSISLENQHGRFFGLHILRANLNDDILRISSIGVYNDEFTRRKTFMEKQFGASAVKNVLPQAVGCTVTQGHLRSLTAAGYAMDEAPVTLEADDHIDLVFPLARLTAVDDVTIFGSTADRADAEVYTSLNHAELFRKENRRETARFPVDTGLADCRAVRLSVQNPAQAAFVGLRFHSRRLTLTRVGVHAWERNIQVDYSRVLNRNFYGAGVNCLPMAMMKESREKGFNEAIWEIEKKRILQVKPNVARLWFQIDWFVTELEDYRNGIYDFDSEKMRDLYYYLDAFKEAGSEIELNFGWKVSKKVQEWFSFPGKFPEGSAPKDLPAFARACSATLRELFRRGYGNIRYLTFYNESICENDFSGPFADLKETAAYWRAMLRQVDRQLREDGLRDKVEIWGTEETGEGACLEYLNDIEGENGSELDVLSSHRYDFTYDEAREVFPRLLAVGTGRKPHVLTEFGVNPLLTSWDRSMTAVVMAVTNFGLSGAFNWIMSDVHMTEPNLFPISWCNNLWGDAASPEGVTRTYGSFYPLSLFMRYVPAHSQTVWCTCSGDDVRAAAYKTPAGEYVVAVEVKNAARERRLSIEFGEPVNRTFYKHAVRHPVHYMHPERYVDGNVTIPACVQEIPVQDTLADTADRGYSLLFYTTEKPYAQVMLEDVNPSVRPGESLCLRGRVLDGDGDLEWSVAASTGPAGTVDSAGRYTADAQAKPGDVVAVRAQLAGPESGYGIALIKIK